MSNLYILNPEVFNSKIERIKKDGISKLHIVSDFDRTLTGESGEGKSPTTSWSIFLSKLGESYAKERNELFNTYFPIERNMTLDHEYKSEQMSIWWQKHLALLVREGVTEETIKEVIREEKLKLRSGVSELFQFTQNHTIPFLIFSAGVGDAIRIHLDSQSLMFENIHILSNFFTFNSEGKATGFMNEIVHPFNKTELLLTHKTYESQIQQRPNCILLGDSLYDATIADEAENKTVLKIGFLNGNSHEKEEFSKAYDALIEEDTSVDSINELLSTLI